MNTLPKPATPASTETGGPIINFPTEEEGRAMMAEALQRMRTNAAQYNQAAELAPRSLTALIECMKHRTGQSYKLRRMLFSLWSGTPCADLSDFLCLDWELKKHFVGVLMGWGCPGSATRPEFYYRALETALRDAGLFDWFREEGGAE